MKAFKLGVCFHEVNQALPASPMPSQLGKVTWLRTIGLQAFDLPGIPGKGLLPRCLFTEADSSAFAVAQRTPCVVIASVVSHGRIWRAFFLLHAQLRLSRQRWARFIVKDTITVNPSSFVLFHSLTAAPILLIFCDLFHRMTRPLKRAPGQFQ